MKKYRLTEIGDVSAHSDNIEVIGSIITLDNDVHKSACQKGYLAGHFEIVSGYVLKTRFYCNAFKVGEINVDIEARCKASKGNQMFSIPNTEEGQQFITLAKKYLNRNKVTMRNRSRGAVDGLPLDKADWIAMYISPKDQTDNGWQDQDTHAELAEAQERIRILEGKIAEARGLASNLYYKLNK